MPPAPQTRRTGSADKTALYVEDFFILLGVAALFVLTVFCRETLWGQVALVAVLAAMAVVFFFRFRRVHRKFTGRDGG